MLGLSTGEELADDDGKISEVDTVGAGSTATRATARPATTAPALPRVIHGTPRVPDMDCHMATRPHTPNTTQATT